MQLRPLYRLKFDYPQSWPAEVKGEGGTEEQHLRFAEGTVDGRLAGRFRGANYARRRAHCTFVTDFRGVIETSDGASVLLEGHGFGRRKTPEYNRLLPRRRQRVATVAHLRDHEAYRWLKDVVCVAAGQVSAKLTPSPTDPGDPVLDVAELVWEPLPD